MSKQTRTEQPVSDAEGLTVSILYPGNRVEKMSVPLEKSALDVEIEPDDPYSRDIVIADNADRNLGREVLRNPLHDATLVYRMRGDVFHELDLWGMHTVKEWIARNIVLPNVGGVIAVSERLAQKFQRETGIEPVGSAGLWKRVSEWPTVEHSRTSLHLITLTNCNYWQKVEAIVEFAPVVDSILSDTGGYWRVCGDGQHTDRLDIALREFENVEFSGYVNAKKALGKSNVMFHPSYLDGQPNSILEGMASNIPVVTNDFAAFTQYDGPIQTVTTDSQLHSILTGLTEPAIRIEYGQRGQAWIRQHHSPEAIARDYERYFVELVA